MPSVEHRRSANSNLNFPARPLTPPQENEAYTREYRRSAVHVPVEDVAPMDEAFIGGFKNIRAPSPLPPALPPKDYPYAPSRHDHRLHHAPQPAQQHQPATSAPGVVSPSQLAHMSAVERSQALRVPRMDPHLQVRPL